MMIIKISNLSDLEVVVEDVKNQIWDQIGKQAVILCLMGDLGAGKTAFTKIMLKKLGITNEVVSPTYVLHNEYLAGHTSDIRVNHIDLWRMESVSELMRIGFEEMVQNKSLIVIEWADKFLDEIKKYKNVSKQIWIEIEQGNEEGSRTIRIEQ